MNQVDRVAQILGKEPEAVTADKGYASGANYEALEQRGIAAVIPPQKERRPAGDMPLSRFSYDKVNDIVRCPGGKTLIRRTRSRYGWFYRSRAADCAGCRFKSGCMSGSSRCRSIMIIDGFCSLLRARRAKSRGWDEQKIRLYNRHRNQVEGVHGEQKTEHGLRRAARRGLWNVQIQSYLSAMAVNLKRLAAHATENDLMPYKFVFRMLRGFMRLSWRLEAWAC